MSGVYISGMEMPISCAECRFYGEYCYAKGDENKYSDLPCPLIPVPEHGDLIDKQYAYQNTMTLGEHTRKTVLKQIDALPVVIPADIKTMYYPQVDGVTPTVIKPQKEEA